MVSEVKLPTLLLVNGIKLPSLHLLDQVIMTTNIELDGTVPKSDQSLENPTEDLLYGLTKKENISLKLLVKPLN